MKTVLQSCMLLLLLPALAIFQPTRAVAETVPGIGTAQGITVSFVKITNKEADPVTTPQIASPVGSQVTIYVEVQYGAGTTINGVTVSYHETGVTTPTQQLTLSQLNTTLPDSGSGNSVIHSVIYNGIWDTSKLFNNFYVLQATANATENYGTLPVVVNSENVQPEVENLIIDLDSISPNIIFVKDGIVTPNVISCQLYDAVAADTTITINIYPTERKINDPPIKILTKVINVPNLLSITWDGTDSNGKIVKDDSYVFSINAIQNDGDHDFSSSTEITIDNTNVQLELDDYNNPIRMIGSYSLYNNNYTNNPPNANMATLIVYAPDNTLISGPLNGDCETWIPGNAPSSGMNDIVSIPLFSLDEYGSYIFLFQAQDNDYRLEKAHRNKWSIARNHKERTAWNEVYYINESNVFIGWSNCLMDDNSAWAVKTSLTKIYIPSRTNSRDKDGYPIADWIPTESAEGWNPWVNDFDGRQIKKTLNKMGTSNRGNPKNYIVIATHGNPGILGNIEPGQPKYPKWIANSNYYVGQIVMPSKPNQLMYTCMRAGISGRTEPNWPTEAGDSIFDNTIQWQTTKVPDNQIKWELLEDNTIIDPAPYLAIQNKGYLSTLPLGS